VSQALIDAAATLFSERPSGRVTVREIASRANVNPTLVHRYFGTKQHLMRAAMEQSQRHIAARLTDVADVRRDLGVLFHATLDEKEFIAALARASLDGVLPDFPTGYPTMGGLLRLLEARLDGGASPGRLDPRVVVACLGAATLGYALFGEFILRGTRLNDEPHDLVEDAIVDVLSEIVGLALADPGRARDTRSEEAV
jgi:AcrR family transcriptional regulator